MMKRLNKTLYVGNLSPFSDEYALEQFFEGFGPIAHIRVSYSPDGYSNGYAHVEFRYPEDALDALDNLDGLELNGKILRIEVAQKLG
mmetsp:Transcript_8609/g.14555  ORF Transcript_8609/g.14555 Transcript_8609/m.14555 type:complete len:87 (+) Transcript_8609:1667-1927(+)